MPHLDRWVVGGLLMVIGLFGLYLSSRADEQIMYYTGLALFVGSVLFNFFQIKQAYSKQSKHK
jgi:NADH:ubiquinone oxidoreductase subunit K